MFDAFAEQVGFDKVRRTQRSAQNINRILVRPQPGVEHVSRVSEESAIMNVMDG